MFHKHKVLAYLLITVIGTASSLPTAQADTLRIGGSGAGLGTIRLLAEAFVDLRPEVDIEIPDSLGSGGGIMATQDGALDIGLSVRPLTEEERAFGSVAIGYAETPFVVVTSATIGNLTTISSDSLVDIFAALQTNWEDGTPIRLILRPDHHNDGQILSAHIEGMDEALERSANIDGLPTAYTDQHAMNMAEVLPGAVTTTTLTAIIAEGRRLVPITIDGVEPTVENLMNGSYVLSKTLYLVRSPNARPIAMEFVDFVLSPQGAEILRATGNIVLPTRSQ